MFKPVRWVSHQAATGLKDLPQNSAWLLSKALAAPTSVTKAASGGITDSIRRKATNRPSEENDTVENRLKRAEAAIASAKQAEQDAVAEARHVKDLADTAKQAADEGEARVRQALHDAEQEVDRRMRAARVRFAQLLDEERDKAGRDTAEAVQRVTAEVRSSVEKTRGVAQAAAELAQDRIMTAQQQMAEARSLAAEAAAAAERLANQAREQARAIAEQAQGLGTPSAGTEVDIAGPVLTDETACVVVTDVE